MSEVTEFCAQQIYECQRCPSTPSDRYSCISRLQWKSLSSAWHNNEQRHFLSCATPTLPAQPLHALSIAHLFLCLPQVLFLLNEGGYRNGKLWKTREMNSTIVQNPRRNSYAGSGCRHYAFSHIEQQLRTYALVSRKMILCSTWKIPYWY